ncbi:MAG: hypothetical protein HZC41_02395 [Chloroflexi bacterium]|nr:hypothetical protein [Chloroflexota bacterium]
MGHWTRLAALFAVLLLLLLAGAVAAQEATPEATPAPVTTPAAADTTPGSSGLLTGLRHLHSLVRWILVLVVVAALVKLVMGLTQNTPYDRQTERLMRAFSIATGVQWLIGLVFFIVLASQIGGFGNLQPYNWLHLIVMTVGTGLAEMHRRFKDAPDRSRYRSSLIIVVMVLVLVFIGVALLPYGWRAFPPTP